MFAQSEYLGQAQFVRFAGRAVAVSRHLLGMLDAQIIVNLLLQLGIGVNLVNHRYNLRLRSRRSHHASGRFSVASVEMMRAPSHVVAP